MPSLRCARCIRFTVSTQTDQGAELQRRAHRRRRLQGDAARLSSTTPLATRRERLERRERCRDRGGEATRIMTSEPALRIIMRRLREIMAEPADGQSRLDKIVAQIAGVMVAEVCSIYLKRQDGSLELFATEGLNPGAVHNTLHEARRGPRRPLRRARRARSTSPRRRATRPSPTGRRRARRSITRCSPCRSCAAARCWACSPCRTARRRNTPTRTSRCCRRPRWWSPSISSPAPSPGAGTARSSIAQVAARGHRGRADLGRHGARPRRAARAAHRRHQADGRGSRRTSIGRLETRRRRAAARRSTRCWSTGNLSGAGEHREVLEAYRMFAHDQGWLRRMREAVKGGLTAEAAVERVQNDTRARMLRQNDPYWRERLRDLDDLSDRLLRICRPAIAGAASRRAAARHHPGRPHHGPGRAARLRPQAPARPGASRKAAARATSPSSPRRWASPPIGQARGVDRARRPGRSAISRRRERRGAHAPLAAR